MLLYILWQCGLVLSTFINIPMSALAYMRFRLKDKEFYNYLKNRSLKDKILFNIKNAVRFFLPIYNIIYPIKLLSCGGLKYVMAKWKKEILNSEKNKGKFKRKIKGFFENVKTEVKEFKDEFFPSKKKSKEIETSKSNEIDQMKDDTKKTSSVETVKPAPTTSKKTTTVPTKKVDTDSRELTPKRINFYLDQYRKEYTKLRTQYESLKVSNAPVSELNKIVRNMNALALRSQQLIDLRNGMNQEKTQSGVQMKLKR